MGRLARVDVAAVVAASLAAMVSLANVGLTQRLNRQLSLQQRRREEVKPVVVQVLGLSREAMDTWNRQAVLRSSLLHVGDDPGRHTETLKLQNEDFGIWQKGQAPSADFGTKWPIWT
jgi:hypothetical protein